MAASFLSLSPCFLVLCPELSQTLRAVLAFRRSSPHEYNKKKWHEIDVGGVMLAFRVVLEVCAKTIFFILHLLSLTRTTDFGEKDGLLLI